eukprot:scaffold1972_cov19-Tisochrysis_lutea.AAC.2
MSVKIPTPKPPARVAEFGSLLCTLLVLIAPFVASAHAADTRTRIACMRAYKETSVCCMLCCDTRPRVHERFQGHTWGCHERGGGCGYSLEGQAR